MAKENKLKTSCLLDRNLIRQIDQYAKTEHRSRNNTIEVLISEALSARLAKPAEATV